MNEKNLEINIEDKERIISFTEEAGFKNPVIFKPFFKGKGNFVNLLVEDNKNSKVGIDNCLSYRKMNLRKKIEDNCKINVNVMTSKQINNFYLSQLDEKNSLSLEREEKGCKLS